ncbi:hypothetical protein P7K49_024954, partial [Saguinus oedipus]
CCVTAHQELLLEPEHRASLTEPAPSSRIHSSSGARPSAVAVAVAAARSGHPAARARREPAVARVSSPASPRLPVHYAGH